jgi:hypothetical protein
MRTQLLLIFMLIACFSARSSAQSCVPDPLVADSAGFVFPAPYHPVNSPEGGIDQPACIDQYFEFVWTIQVPEDVTIFGFSVQLEYLKLETAGAVTNLPDGINYVCNPPNCQFNVNEPGCVLLYGTPTSGNTPGVYDLGFTGSLKTVSGGVLPVSFPDANLYPGNYYLNLLPANDPGCISGTGNLIQGINQHQFVPNPILDWATFEILSTTHLSGQLMMVDLTGRSCKSVIVEIEPGQNSYSMDLSDLSPGFWIYRFVTHEGQEVTGTFVKHSW